MGGDKEAPAEYFSDRETSLKEITIFLGGYQLL
jgi:hypothetical protein